MSWRARVVGTVVVLIISLMAALGVAGDVWTVRTTPMGAVGIIFIGLFVSWIGVSLLMPGRRRS